MPKPVSSYYQEIDDTVCKVVQDLMEAEDAEAAKELYTLSKMEYSGGTFTASLEMPCEKDTPMSSGPDKVIEALRALPDVQSVGYTGYKIETQKLKGDKDAEGEPILDDDGNQIGTKEPETEKRTITLPLSIKMKGGKIDLDKLGKKEATKK
jgi:hypothetical protein